MSVAQPTALQRYVQVLELQKQQAHTAVQQAQARLQATQARVAHLQHMGLTAGLKKTAGNVALYANAAGFRSGLIEMVAQCRDLCGVQQLEAQQALQQAQAAARRHGSMDHVVQQVHSAARQAQARQAQKVMDEMAGQAWMRQYRTARQT